MQTFLLRRKECAIVLHNFTVIENSILSKILNVKNTFKNFSHFRINQNEKWAIFGKDLFDFCIYHLEMFAE